MTLLGAAAGSIQVGTACPTRVGIPQSASVCRFRLTRSWWSSRRQRSPAAGISTLSSPVRIVRGGEKRVRMSGGVRPVSTDIQASWSTRSPEPATTSVTECPGLRLAVPRSGTTKNLGWRSCIRSSRRQMPVRVPCANSCASGDGRPRTLTFLHGRPRHCQPHCAGSEASTGSFAFAGSREFESLQGHHDPQSGSVHRTTAAFAPSDASVRPPPSTPSSARRGDDGPSPRWSCPGGDSSAAGTHDRGAPSRVLGRPRPEPLHPAGHVRGQTARGFQCAARDSRSHGGRPQAVAGGIRDPLLGGMWRAVLRPRYVRELLDQAESTDALSERRPRLRALTAF